MDTAHRQAQVRATFPELGRLQDPELQEKIVDIWVKLWEEGGWALLDECPFFSKIPRFSLVAHVRHVTANAISLAESLREYCGVESDMDTVIALGLLHDVSKLVEYERQEDGFAKSVIGQTLPHGHVGAEEARRAGLSDRIVHAIVMHPYHPPHIHVKPRYVEQLIIHYADLSSADPLLFSQGLETHLEFRRFFSMGG